MKNIRFILFIVVVSLGSIVHVGNAMNDEAVINHDDGDVLDLQELKLDDPKDDTTLEEDENDSKCKRCCFTFKKCCIKTGKIVAPIMVTFGGILSGINPVAGTVITCIGNVLAKLLEDKKEQEQVTRARTTTHDFEYFARLGSAEIVLSDLDPVVVKHLEGIWDDAQKSINKKNRVKLAVNKALNPQAYAILNIVLEASTHKSNTSHEQSIGVRKNLVERLIKGESIDIKTLDGKDATVEKKQN